LISQMWEYHRKYTGDYHHYALSQSVLIKEY